jgi:hypothetical protein
MTNSKIISLTTCGALLYALDVFCEISKEEISVDSLICWGERGLVSTMLLDIYQSSMREGWTPFFDTFHFVKPFWEGRTITSFSVVVEPDFSNEGFGHPDAIAKFEFEDQASVVVILEAKRLPYSKTCLSPTQRGGAGYNSKLNGQLELNHCLALALSSFRGEQEALGEPEWVLYTPYGSDRRGKLRCLKNPVVVEEIARPCSGLEFRSYYHLLITTDPSDPLDDPKNQPLWPELFHPDFPFQNCWRQLRGQFAWASWDKIETTVQRLRTEGKLQLPSLFLPTIEKNRRNFKAGIGSQAEEALTSIESDPDSTLEPGEENDIPISAELVTTKRGSRGATMIYAPSINPKTFLHFSWLNDSCAIRDYSQSPNILPLEDRSMNATAVRSRIKREVSVRNRPPISNTKYWHETTLNLNKTEMLQISHQ